MFSFSFLSCKQPTIAAAALLRPETEKLQLRNSTSPPIDRLIALRLHLLGLLQLITTNLAADGLPALDAQAATTLPKRSHRQMLWQTKPLQHCYLPTL